MTVIFARSTAEIGNVSTLARLQFFQALAAAVGASNVAVQGVGYPADIPRFLAGGDAGGSAKMASLAAWAMSQCPNTKVMMAGYRYVPFRAEGAIHAKVVMGKKDRADATHSQGGQLVHNAAKMMPVAQTAAMSSGKILPKS